MTTFLAVIAVAFCIELAFCAFARKPRRHDSTSDLHDTGYSDHYPDVKPEPPL